MKQTDNKLNKKRFNLKELAIFLAIAAVFVGPRLLSDPEINPAVIEAVQDKVGTERFENMMKSTLPLGYLALCIEKNGDNPELIEAAKSFNSRNHNKMVALINSIESDDGLTADEKKIIDKYAYAKAINDIKTENIKCDTLARKIDNGNWDL